MRAHLRGDQAQVLVQGLRQRDDRVLARVVHAHVGRVQQPGHAGRVDDVATPGGVGRSRLQHHRREHAHPVGHAHQVDADHPLPVARRVLPDEPPAADAGVVEDEARHAEGLPRGRAQRVHLGRLRHVQPEGQHGRPEAADLGRRGLQRVGLHIGHDHAHAAPRREPARLQAEAGRRAGDDGGAAGAECSGSHGVPAFESILRALLRGATLAQWLRAGRTAPLSRHGPTATGHAEAGSGCL